jgi:isopenicillin-N epimerase
MAVARQPRLESPTMSTPLADLIHPDLIRTEWDLDPSFLTVNHGSFGATPRYVLAAQRAWQDQMEYQPTRFMGTRYQAALRAAADSLAAFLHADGKDLVFVDNTTTGCNAVLQSLTLQPGDSVTILSHAYGAVRNAVQFVTTRAGAQITEAKITFPNPTEDSLVTAVTDTFTAKTRLAVIDHITSASAIVLPVQRIVAACHTAGIPVLIDGAHAPGQIDLDLTSIAADWYVGNGHKWLCAPKGCAFLHAQPAAQSALHPGTISHGYGQGFLAEFDWTGTTDPSRFLAITAALDFHHRLGGATLRRRNQALAAEAGALLAQRLNTQVGTSGATAGAMATIRLPVDDPSQAHALAIRQRLLQAGTDAPVHALDGALWLRLSAFAYNQQQDYVQLAERVASALRA